MFTGVSAQSCRNGLSHHYPHFLSGVPTKTPTGPTLILRIWAGWRKPATHVGPHGHPERKVSKCQGPVPGKIPVLLTGDKRAITAMERLLDTELRLHDLCGRVRCLEQAFLCVLDRKDSEALRSAVCTEPTVDKALTICFGCSSPTTQRETVLEGLASYIRALRTTAPRVLAN